jgi:hypothetical protein
LSAFLPSWDDEDEEEVPATVEDQFSLSQYDVSEFPASQLFELVNIGETLPQYEEVVVFQALTITEPFSDTAL